MKISERTHGGFRDRMPPIRAATMRRIKTCCSRKVAVLLVAVAAALMCVYSQSSPEPLKIIIIPLLINGLFR